MSPQRGQTGEGRGITVQLRPECFAILQKYRRVQRDGQTVTDGDGEVVSNLLVTVDLILTLMASMETERVNRALDPEHLNGCRLRQCETCRRRERENHAKAARRNQGGQGS